MKKLLIATAALAAMLGAAGSAAAQTAGHEFVFRWDDSDDIVGLHGITIEDGNVIQDANVGAEDYNSSYGLSWNDGGVLAENVNLAFNIYDPDGALSDTWALFGNAGDQFLNIPFHSDFEGGGGLIPYENGAHIVETGDWQTVAQFTLANGDHFTWQFRSDVEGGVPEPATWSLMIGGFGLAGAALRRRRAAVTA